MGNLDTWPTQSMFAKNGDKAMIQKMLKHKHMIETIERFEWINLPPELTTDLIERILFYRFKGAFFKYNDKHFFLPFALKGTIDSYGRYISIVPVLFTGAMGQDKKDSMFLPPTAPNAMFDVKYRKGMEPGKFPAVILTDSTLEIAQEYTPMNELINPLIEQMTEILVLVNIDLISSAKMFYIVAPDESTRIAIEDEFQNLDQRILDGKRVVVLTSKLELKELTGNAQAKDQARYFQTYQSFDNLRKDIIGSSNGGAFLKQEHMTTDETSLNSSSASAVLENALRQRKEFCELVNEYFNLTIDVKIKENQSKPIVEEEGQQTKDNRGDNDASV